MKFIRNILLPLVPVYFLVTWVRNKLYDFGIKKSISFDFPVICVGNLSVGGTGKSPMIEYLINLLKDDFKLATLSRGYKRKTKGFHLADINSTSETLGDEPLQFYNKFGSNVIVAVDSNRANGINKLRNLDIIPEVILLDDAFQHRKVKPGFNILLTTYSNPYFNDMVLPTGNLREPINGVKRANIVVVTKSPKNLNQAQKDAIIEKIYSEANQHIFFSSIEYSNEIISINSTKNITTLPSFTLVTGIANSNPLVDFLKEKELKFEHLNFKDHHDFSDKDIEILNRKELIVTTEKDFMRLQQYASLRETLFYLPIFIKIDNTSLFNSLVKAYIKR